MIDVFIDNPNFIITVVVGLIGLLIILIAVYYLYKTKESENWSIATGTIISSEVNKKRNNSEGDYDYTYKPEICYFDYVDGHRYVSNQIKIIFNYPTSSSKWPYSIVAKYPRDAIVTVYYNPDDPSDSVLEPGFAREIIVLFVLGFAILGIACWFANKNGLMELLLNYIKNK